MINLAVPAAIFVAVMFVGLVADQFGLENPWKIILLCIIAVAVQVLGTRLQRRRR